MEKYEVEEENGIELSLGLSIGGGGRSFRKKLREVPIDINSDPREEDDPETTSFESELNKKREVQAKRRLEARRKREEKQIKKGVRRPKNNNNNEDNGSSREDDEYDDVGEGECKRKKLECKNGEVCCFNPYPDFQFIPFTNGYRFPFGYGTGGNGECKVGAGEESNCGSNGSDSNCGTRLGGSNNGSGGCSSSAISENRSISSQGGSSSDSGSNLSRSKSGRMEVDASSGSDIQEPSASCPLQCTQGMDEASYQLQSTQGIHEEANHAKKEISSNIFQPRPVKPKEEAAPGSPPNPRIKPRIPQIPVKENKGDTGKPPKPQSQSQDTSALLHMPCVSTTGNGPNGKTITGFLYRYTKTEVSIICVCHGKSFSPSEFVEHAGGVDVLQPLRHITVAPPFGQ